MDYTVVTSSTGWFCIVLICHLMLQPHSYTHTWHSFETACFSHSAHRESCLRAAVAKPARRHRAAHGLWQSLHSSGAVCRNHLLWGARHLLWRDPPSPGSPPAKHDVLPVYRLYLLSVSVPAILIITFYHLYYCFYWFNLKHLELQFLYEMCYINKVLLTYLLTNLFLVD